MMLSATTLPPNSNHPIKTQAPFVVGLLSLFLEVAQQLLPQIKLSFGLSVVLGSHHLIKPHK